MTTLKDFDITAKKAFSSHSKFIHLITVTLPKIAYSAAMIRQIAATLGYDRLYKAAHIRQHIINMQWAAYEYETLDL